MSIYIGIDPGITGAMAAIGTMVGGEEQRVDDMPVMEKMRSSERATLDPAKLRSWLMNYCAMEPTVIIEQLHPQPKIGAVTNFSMGYSYGMLITILDDIGFRYIQVSPAKWKKAMGLNAMKDLSRQMAIELFPKMKEDLKLKKHHGRAEALLLAEYGRRLYEGKR